MYTKVIDICNFLNCYETLTSSCNLRSLENFENWHNHVLHIIYMAYVEFSWDVVITWY